MCRVLSLQLRKLMNGKTVLGVGNVIVILLQLLQNSRFYNTDFYSFATATNGKYDDSSTRSFLNRFIRHKCVT